MMITHSKLVCIADARAEREPLAAWRVFTGPTPAQWMDHLGVEWPAAWCILRASPAHFDGDIDVLVGRLASEPAITKMLKQDRRRAAFFDAAQGIRFHDRDEGQLKFDLSYLVGMEVKCAYIGEEVVDGMRHPKLKSTKPGPGKQLKHERQLRKLLKLGLDKVCLLDVVGGIPSAGAGSKSVVDREHERLTDGFASCLPVGHIGLTLGPVSGYSEDMGGSYDFHPIQEAPDNPCMADSAVIAQRQLLTKYLSGIFQDANLRKIPVVLDLCPLCGNLGDYHGEDCSPRHDRFK
jgi:hypothetical protein